MSDTTKCARCAGVEGEQHDSYADHAFVAEMSTQKSDEQLVIDAIECRVVAAMIFITDDDDADASVLERAYANSDDARAALLARMAEKDATIAALEAELSEHMLTDEDVRRMAIRFDGYDEQDIEGKLRMMREHADDPKTGGNVEAASEFAVITKSGEFTAATPREAIDTARQALDAAIEATRTTEEAAT